MSLTPSLLDLKLALRMLRKYPALSIIGGLGMAVSIAVSVGFFAFMQSQFFPTLPLPEGDRIVAIENHDTQRYGPVREALHDFAFWRSEIRTVADLSAFQMVGRNLVVNEGTPEPVAVAEMTASAFVATRVAPLMGRYLSQSDEAAGAPKVVVIGYKEWQERFAGNPHIVGTEVRLSGTLHTVVGVMPEQFAFPFNHHYWTPLRVDASAHARRTGPSIFVFGRLAPGATMESVQAELDVLGRRAAADFPKTNGTLVPRVMPYTNSFTGQQGTTKMMGVQLQLLMSLLLVVVALNVAVLVYARTATRHGELAVRNALGATRTRIVRQLFLEGLLLSVIAAAVGLGIAQFGLRLANDLMANLDGSYGAPFWVDYSLQASTVFFTVGVAVIAAVIVGVLPALQATGRTLQDSLRQVSAGSGVKLGKTWTSLIVAQVAIAAAALPAAVGIGIDVIRESSTAPTYDASRFLVTSIRAGGTDTDAGLAGADSVRFGQSVALLMERVSADPAVLGVTYSAQFTRGGERIEVEGIALPENMRGEYAVEPQGVAPNMLQTFGARTLAGRGFVPGDADTTSTAIVVNRAFAQRAFGSASALGQRVRYAGREGFADFPAVPPSKWYTIVGVAGDMEANALDYSEVQPVVYHAVALGSTGYVELRIHTRGDAASFVPALRKHVVAVDPAMRLGRSFGLDELQKQNALAKRLAALVVGLVLVSVSLLSAAGVYALTSFTVTRRRREIGIRSALGAGPAQVLRDIFTRVARQIAIGLAVGIAGAAVVNVLAGGDVLAGRAAVLLPAFAAIMTVVMVLAAVGPARRGLRIEPAEALRAEA